MFDWMGTRLLAHEGETIAAALFAHGIHTFGHHPRDGAPQGLFCANGQCAQCLVLADGRPVKACMTPVHAGMRVDPLDGLPQLPARGGARAVRPPETVSIPVLILGGGPAGMAAAVELGGHGVEAILVDDRERLGGKLVLQTHRFFGSADAVYAGNRGIHIAEALAREVDEAPSIRIWRGSTAVGVYTDRVVGIVRGERYVLVRPEALLVATGARERSLVFPGNTLPGVYGAGAFQTLVNRDRVRAAERLFIVGGGNVGLIAGYHALQAGIDVVGVVEALPECGGYRVHRDKLRRHGVPIHTSHTVLAAHGRGHVESITIARVDEAFRPDPATAQRIACDTVLIAVGLDPVDEFLDAARTVGLPAWAAGDAHEVAEASAAIYSGRIQGRAIAHHLGATAADVPPDWRSSLGVLKSKPGRTHRRPEPRVATVRPVFHCVQEIPCDPCAAACRQGLIRMPGGDIRSLPEFLGDREGASCSGCMRCLAVCPGLAITLVDRREDAEHPRVTIPIEFEPSPGTIGRQVTACDAVGHPVGSVTVLAVRAAPGPRGTHLVTVQADATVATRIAGLLLHSAWAEPLLPEAVEPLADEAIVCRCERVTAGEIRALIARGIRDENELKALSRAGMGACGGKTCRRLIGRLFREAGVDPEEVCPETLRPLFVEVPLATLAGDAEDEDDDA
jgi:NADPH-dependent 2,4-dienoyl-CoA reductase/sulfur reductase-like enzyme/ferredoxin